MKKRALAMLLALVMCFSLMIGSTTAFAEAATDTAEDYSGGSPWIDSNIQSNVEASEEADLKDNFELAINRQWVLDNPIETGKYMNDYLNSFEPELDERLLSILQDDSLADDPNAQLVQSLYNAFLDWDAREADGVEPLMPYLQTIEDMQTIEDFDAFAASPDYALASVLTYLPFSDPQDATRYIIAVGSTPLYLTDPAAYADLENMDAYTQLYYQCYGTMVYTVLSQCGYSDERIQEIYQGCIAFEQLVAANCYTKADSSLTDTLVTIYSQEYTPDELEGFHWFSLIQQSLANYGVDEIPAVLLLDKADYFNSLDALLCDDNMELIRDYLLAHTASAAIDLLDQDTYYAYQDIINAMTGTEGYLDETEYALEQVTNNLGWPLSHIYVDEYVTEEDKQNVRDVIDDIIGGYEEMLQEEEFLSDTTKAAAINKLQSITINCMYPDDWSAYDYSDLELSGNYFDIMKEISMYTTERLLSKFNEPIDKTEWANTPLELNAFYDRNNNSINILCGLVGDVLYNADMPAEEVYAKIGSVIGHEISHAFDAGGALYDANGNYSNWWTDEDYANFTELTNKLVAYYDTITIWDGLDCSGEQVKVEVCADMGGIAVLLHLAKSIPDFDYDTFFRAYARLWADNETALFVQYRCANDGHPLNYLRVNVVLAQFEEFYETYGIQEGDGMYIAPENRVAIW